MSNQEQIEKLSGAVALALLTSQEVPLVMPNAALVKVAESLFATGVRWTDQGEVEVPPMPQWVREAMAEQQEATAVDVPDGALPESGSACVAESPSVPSRIAKKSLGSVL